MRICGPPYEHLCNCSVYRCGDKRWRKLVQMQRQIYVLRQKERTVGVSQVAPKALARGARIFKFGASGAIPVCLSNAGKR
jgi:hypothetical protein